MADTGRDTGSSRRDTARPSRDTGPDTGWWGPIVERGGRRFRAAAHIARTGDSPPELEADPGPERDDLDDALDLVADLEPDTLDEWLAWASQKGIGYNERARRAAELFGTSESTAKRRMRDLGAQR